MNSIVLATCGEYYETALQENPLNEVKIFTFDYEGEMDYTIVSNFFKFIHAGILGKIDKIL